MHINDLNNDLKNYIMLFIGNYNFLFSNINKCFFNIYLKKFVKKTSIYRLINLNENMLNWIDILKIDKHHRKKITSLSNFYTVDKNLVQLKYVCSLGFSWNNETYFLAFHNNDLNILEYLYSDINAKTFKKMKGNYIN